NEDLVGFAIGALAVGSVVKVEECIEGCCAHVNEERRQENDKCPQKVQVTCCTVAVNKGQQECREAHKFCADLDYPEELLDCRISQRSEEHTSELQSRENLVCRLLLEKKIIRHA